MIHVRRPFAPRAARALGLVASSLALLVLTVGRASSEIVTLDEGKFIVSLNGKPARVEEFYMDRSGDTLVVRAGSYLSADVQAGRRPDKTMELQLGALDYAFVRYHSQHIMGPDTLRRGVETTPGDTLFTLWRELNDHGVGDRLALPPGRVFILDPPLFTTFNLIARTLHGKTFDQRPIIVLVLGTPDTLVETTVTDLGTETIRWGARAIGARKLLLADQQTRFTAWIAPDGRMLRLEQPEAGILVERQAPPLKRQAPPPKRRAPRPK
jgi:hypothetical protein